MNLEENDDGGPTCRVGLAGIGEALLGLRQEFVAIEAQLAMTHLADATMLPFVMFTDADGCFLTGSHGAVYSDRFREVIEGCPNPKRPGATGVETSSGFGSERAKATKRKPRR